MTHRKLFYFASALFALSAASTLRAQTNYVGSNSSGVSSNFTSGTNSYSATYIGFAVGANSNSLSVENTNTVLTNSGVLRVGESGSGNSMVISSGGTVRNTTGIIGSAVAASNNSVVVTGTGSFWSNSSSLNVGSNAAANSLVISNGGKVQNAAGSLGAGANTASNNSVMVTGTGSLWTSAGITVGGLGSGNSIVVADGGVVQAGILMAIGSDSGASNNSVLVTGSNSLLVNRSFRLGVNGSGNSLVISNGGAVQNVGGSGVLGFNATSSNNSALVTGAGSTWSNSGILQVGRLGSGTLTVAGGGSVQATGITIAESNGSAGTLNIGRFGTNDSAGTITAPTIAFGSGTGAINFNQSNATTLSNAISGNGTVNQRGTGTTTLRGSNSYSGVTTISAGTLLFSNATSLYGGSNANWTAANIIVASNATAAFGVGGASSFTTSNITTLLGNLTTVNSNGLQAGSSIGFDTTAGAFTLTNNVADSTGTGGGALGLSKLGTGTLTLSGSNSYSGGTTISAGALVLGNTNALSGSTLDYSSAGTVSFGALSGANLGGLQGATNLALTNASGAAVALSVGGNNSNTTYSGILSGAGSLTKAGAGTMVLGASNTYSGGTLVSAGSLAGDTTSLQGNITNNGSVVFSQAADGTYAGVLSGTGSLLKTNAGTLILSAANTQSGGTLIGAGALQIGNSGTTGSLAGLITNNSSLIYNRSDNLTQSTAISGAGSLTKLGAGTLLLSASNSYSGGTWINGGTLTAGNLYAFGTGAVTVGLNTFLDMANYSLANALTNNGGTILNAGTISGGDFTGGTTDLSGANSTVAEVSGTATVNVSGANITISNVVGGTVNVNGAGATIQSYNGGNVGVGAGLSVTMNDGNSSGVISGSGGMTKNSAGVLTLGGVNIHTGATTVADGKLVVDGSIALSEVTVNNGGTLAGSGTVGALTILDGATLSPGNSPGNLGVAGNVTWSGGGNYNWQIYDTTLPAGTGWDLVTSGGALDLTPLTSANKFNLNLWSLSGIAPDVDGDALNFDNTQNYTWTILTAATGINGFAADKFNINPGAANGTAGFANALGGGTFSLLTSGNSLNLMFTAAGGAAVPEPGTWAAAALLVGGAAFMRWRKRKQVS